MFEAVLALVVMTNIDKYNWNWLLGLSAVPIIISTSIVPVSQPLWPIWGLVVTHAYARMHAHTNTHTHTYVS